MTDKEKYLILGVIVVGAGAWWYFSQQQAATAITAASTTASLPTSAASVAPPITTTSSSTSSALPWFQSANAGMVSAITGWINSNPQPSATNWLNYFTTRGTQTDINTMYQLITQYWSQNIAPPYSLDNYFTNLSNAANG